MKIIIPYLRGRIEAPGVVGRNEIVTQIVNFDSSMILIDSSGSVAIIIWVIDTSILSKYKLIFRLASCAWGWENQDLLCLLPDESLLTETLDFY